MKDATYRYDSADEMYDDLLTVLSPERANEKKFAIVFDDDRTRAIPIVSETPKFDSVEATKKIEPVKLEQSPPPPPKKRKKWPFIVGGIAGVAILILLLSLIPGVLGPKKAVIPDVAGMEEAEAGICSQKKALIRLVRRGTAHPMNLKKGKSLKRYPKQRKNGMLTLRSRYILVPVKKKATLPIILAIMLKSSYGFFRR